MTWPWVAGITGGLCSLISVRPYIRGILAGKRVSPLSWVIWTALCWILLAALWDTSGGWRQLAPVVLTATEAAGCTIILALSLYASTARNGRVVIEEELSPVAAGLILVAVAGALAGWLFAGPVLAACLLLGVDFAGGGVTVKRLWRKPASEPLGSWWWYGMGECWATVSAFGPHWHWVYSASSLSGLAVAASIIAAAWRGGVTVSLTTWVLQREEA